MEPSAMPEFTDEEQYLISAVRAEQQGSNTYMWTYVCCALLLAGTSAFYGNPWGVLSAVVVVCGFRLYEEYYQARWTPVWKSVIRKYEQAILDASRPQAGSANAPARTEPTSP
jgi:hypothetical protein